VDKVTSPNKAGDGSEIVTSHKVPKFYNFFKHDEYHGVNNVDVCQIKQSYFLFIKTSFQKDVFEEHQKLTFKLNM